jgi:hypothetical protein
MNVAKMFGVNHNDQEERGAPEGTCSALRAWGYRGLVGVVPLAPRPPEAR